MKTRVSRHLRFIAVAGLMMGGVMAASAAPAAASVTSAAVVMAAPGDHAYCDDYVYEKRGNGACVELIQYYLTQYGFGSYLRPDGIDGEFGQKTHNAVVAFQRRYGLQADGKVGPRTWAKFSQLA